MNKLVRYVDVPSTITQWSELDEIAEKVDRLPDNSLNKVVPMPVWEQVQAMLVLFLTIPGAFLWQPILWGVFAYMYPTPLGFTLLLLWIVTLAILPAWCSKTVLHSHLLKLVLKYFSFAGVWKQRLDKNEKHILVAPPHGVFPFGNVLTIIFFYLYGDFHIRGLAATIIHRIPIIRHAMAWLGIIDAGRNSAYKALKKGHSLGLSSGGIAEIFECTSEHETIVMEDRKGFVKLAMQTGAKLVPCYLFGNTKALTCLTDSAGRLQRLSRKLRASITLFWGRFFLPIPYRVPISGVMGLPLDVPFDENPSRELVNEYHAKFIARLNELFDEHKHAYGWADRELIVK